jgi:hypothetical protein
MRANTWNDQARIIATELEAMDAETMREYVKTLPSDAVGQARGVDHGLGQAKAIYLPGSDEKPS